MLINDRIMWLFVSIHILVEEWLAELFVYFKHFSSVVIFATTIAICAILTACDKPFSMIVKQSTKDNHFNIFYV